jgi:hypothetical protein
MHKDTLAQFEPDPEAPPDGQPPGSPADTTIPSWLQHQTFEDMSQLFPDPGDANPPSREVYRRIEQDLRYIEEFRRGMVRRRGDRQ